MKPHGALYNTIVTNGEQGGAVAEAVHLVDAALPVLGMAGSAFFDEATRLGLRTVPEAFADRAYRPFDLAAGPLLRAGLVARGRREPVLWLAVHHIAADFWSVEVLLGAGQQSFSANLGHGIDTASSLTLEVQGGSGNDSLSVTVTGGAPVAGNLSVQLLGGHGKDTISFNYEAEVDGTLKFVGDAGYGKNTVHANITVDANSSGTVSAQVNGGHGRNDLGLSVTGDGLGSLSSLDVEALRTRYSRRSIRIMTERSPRPRSTPPLRSSASGIPIRMAS